MYHPNMPNTETFGSTNGANLGRGFPLKDQWQSGNDQAKKCLTFKPLQNLSLQSKSPLQIE